MKNLKSCLLLLVLFAFTNMQCEKSKAEKEDKLPAETQEGKNTFGCLVDGVVWLPKGSYPYSGLTTVIQSNILNIAAKNRSESISIGLRNYTAPGTYSLSPEDNEFRIKDLLYKLKDGKITITKLDYSTHIVSGTFHASGINGDKTVVITGGRFDLKFTD